MGVDERIDGDLLWWFGHVERDRIAKSVYVGESAAINKKRYKQCFMQDSSTLKGNP